MMLGSNILSEIKNIIERGAMMNIALPIPNYLFVRKYGRDIKDDMGRISELFGYKEWFGVNPGREGKDGKILSFFKMELDRHAALGKEYEGGILMELSGEEDEHELEELIYYIESNKQRLKCIYSIDDLEHIDEVKRILENYGFVRVVSGERYDISEQIEIFMDILEEYQIQLDEGAEASVAEFFRKKEWSEADSVKKCIQNIAEEIIYCKFIEENVHWNMVTMEEVNRVFRSNQQNQVRKRTIGFAIGGAEL